MGRNLSRFAKAWEKKTIGQSSPCLYTRGYLHSKNGRGRMTGLQRNGSNAEGGSEKQLEPPPEFRHRQYLLALAKANVLPRLLDDGAKMKDMGIPRSDFARLMRKPENHGMKGFEPAKKLLYTMDAEHPDEGVLENIVPSTSKMQHHSTNTNVERQQRWAVHQQNEGLTESKPASASKNGVPGKGASSMTAEYQQGVRKDNESITIRNEQTKKKEADSEEISKNIDSALKQHMIHLQRYTPGEHRVLCPICQGGRQGEKSLSVSIDNEMISAKWNCFRASCGYSGGCHAGTRIGNAAKSGFLVPPSTRKRKEDPPVRPQVELQPLTNEMVDFFKSRGISEDTLSRNKVSAIYAYDPMAKEKSLVMGFPYYSHDLLVNVKYRTLDKRFWQSKGAEKMLYGLNDVVGQNEIIIVEGEMDKLALEEAGILNVVSVPDGAPSRVKEGDLPPVEEDTKYSYLWNSRAWLDQAVRIVIATDNDAPGNALAEELARRLGRERCWRVRWPFTREDHEFVASSFGDEPVLANDGNDVNEKELEPGELDPAWYRKDANEVLMRDGPKMLQNFIESAEPLPIRGLLRFHEYYEDIMKYYYLELKDGQGVKTGWQSLDKYYRVVPGELTIVTGVPNSGKSEWIDALLCNLSEQQGWQFAMCSMEKRATDHARQLAEKYVGKPFFDLPYSRGTARMSFEELDSALDWVDDRFHLIRYEDDELPSVDWVLDIARAAVYRYGIRGLVIDPYNELDHQRPSSMSETEYVSKMLTKVKRFAQTAGVHVWFVAHPRQLHQWKGEAPNLYDISGSAHFINKADNGIVIHRNRDPESESSDSVEILVRKVRNKAAGTIGNCVLSYDRRNGRYVDIDDPSPPRTAQVIPSIPSSQNEISAQRGYVVYQDGTISTDTTSI